jgi:hypothetical protein
MAEKSLAANATGRHAWAAVLTNESKSLLMIVQALATKQEWRIVKTRQEVCTHTHTHTHTHTWNGASSRHAKRYALNKPQP